MARSKTSAATHGATRDAAEKDKVLRTILQYTGGPLSHIA